MNRTCRILAISLAVLPLWFDAAGNWEPVPGNAPGPRKGHSMVAIDGEIYVFGGVGEERINALNDLWEFDLETDNWREVTPQGEKPEARYGHQAAVANGRMYVFSEESSLGNSITDFWTYDSQTNAWAREYPANDWPLGRIHGSMVAIDNAFYIYGGTSGSTALNRFVEVFTGDPTLLSQVQFQHPAPLWALRRGCQRKNVCHRRLRRSGSQG